VLKNIVLKGTPAAMLYADLIPPAVFTAVLALLATAASTRCSMKGDWILCWAASSR